jgi:hypothetical protein
MIYEFNIGFQYSRVRAECHAIAKGPALRSVNRAIILAIINYIELILGFAVIYTWSGSISNKSHVLKGSLESLYFPPSPVEAFEKRC